MGTVTQHDHQHQGAHHGPGYYVKMYLILLVLLVISVVGPEFGIQILTLITAFGIALVKAYMVAAYFMHLKGEKPYIHYMLYTMLILLGLFFVGVSADVMRTQGEHWENVAAKEIIKSDAERMGAKPEGEHKED